MLVATTSATFAAARLLVSRQLVEVRRRPRYPHRVVSVDPGPAGGTTVTLVRDVATERAGTYGLAWRGGHAVVGEVTERTRHRVVRPVVRVDSGEIVPGRVAFDHVDVGDPRAAFGLEFEEISLESDVGLLPAWVVPARGADWVVVVHGYGGRRPSALSFLPMLRRLELNAVVPAYRNDPDAPPSPDGLYHLGATEWRDVDAAIAACLERGAARVVLYGWSMGGAIVLQAAAASPHRDAISCLLLDAPVVDWRAVLLHIGRRRHLPDALVRSAMRRTERRIGVDFDDLDWVRRSGEITVPVLVVHGDGDQTVPVARSSDLARARPDLVRLRIVAGAGHVGSWNVDPSGYEGAVRSFLDEVAVPERS